MSKLSTICFPVYIYEFLLALNKSISTSANLICNFNKKKPLNPCV